MPLEQPSSDFTQKVMQQVWKRAARSAYRPLISKTAWWIIGAIFLTGTLWLFYHPGTTLIDSNAISWKDQFQFNNPFEKLIVSKTTLYAIGFMALFVFQIPFLKRLMDKRYS